jgi:hypothetical protein
MIRDKNAYPLRGHRWKTPLFSCNSHQSFCMQHEGQTQKGDILDGLHVWTKPGKGFQVQELHNKVLGHSQTKRHVGRYRHAEGMCHMSGSICKK